MNSSKFKRTIYPVLEWITNFVVINLLWIFFNIPILLVFFMGSYFMEYKNIVLSFFIFFSMFALFFFPATQAMFASIRNLILKNKNKDVIKLYLYFYKKNYWKSLIGGVVLSFIWFIWFIDLFYSIQMNNMVLIILFIITGILLYVYTINFFSVSAHYDVNLKCLFKKTLMATIVSPRLFLTILFSNIVLIFLSTNLFTFLIPFFIGSLISYISFNAFYKVYLRIIYKNETTSNKDRRII